jgi:dTDP-4-amino-4,6-dideoxygalactose transaminase
VTVDLFGRRAAFPDAAPCPVIEDAAQSIGAGPPRGRAAIVSFFPTKNLSALGDGGAVLTNDEAFAARITLLRSQGAPVKHRHVTVGGNFRLDALQAAVLRVKLPHLRTGIAARRARAIRYHELCAGARLPPEITLPPVDGSHVFNQFVIRAPRRDALRAHLADAGVGSEVYYPVPLHLQECFGELGYRPGAFPKAERAAGEVLALPIQPGLTLEAQVRVVDELARFYR